MRVVEVVELTGPDGVRIRERPRPEGPVVVEVHAAGLSFPDLLRTRGEYQDKAELPFVLGQEFAGVVASAAPDSGFEAGERVAGWTGAVGAAAELVAVEADRLVRLPERLTFEQGAGAVFNYETAIVALPIRGRLQAGETVLVHGAAGGTGTAALQVAKGLGARALAVVSSEAKAEVARAAGADEVLGLDGWKDGALAATDGRGVDVVFDPVGGDRMLDTIRALAPGGRWVVVGFAGGAIPQVPANRLLLKNVDVVGSYLGGYLKQGGEPAAAELRRRLLALLDAGAIDPPVGTILPFERAADGLRELEARRALGKVVLRVRG